MNPNPPRRLSGTLFLALVAVLPLHTVYLRAEIAWKPWLVLLVGVAVLDIWERRRFPWSVRAAIGVLVFLLAVAASWPGIEAGATFWRLLLALAAGSLLLLVTGRHRVQLDDVLKTVFWSGAALAATGFVLAMVTNGVFGSAAVEQINELPFIDRVNKPAYLGSGFVALSNWHQDPGYSALWTNFWIALSIVAWGKGVVSAPRWLAPIVIGGLCAATILTLSRTGWGGLVVAVTAAGIALWRLDHRWFRRGAKVVSWGALVAVFVLAFHMAVDPQDIGGDVGEALEFRVSYLFALGEIDLGEEGVVDPSLVVDDNRLDVWNEYLGRFGEGPLRGIGLGTGWSEPGLQEPHNLGVQLLAETGVVGTLGFLVLLVSLGRGGGPIVGAGLAVGLAAGLTQTVLFEPVLWFALGLWLAGSRSGRDRVGEETASAKADGTEREDSRTPGMEPIGP